MLHAGQQPWQQPADFRSDIILSDSSSKEIPAPFADIASSIQNSSAYSLAFHAVVYRKLLGEDLSSGCPRELPFETF
jgi:hypothetical protein